MKKQISRISAHQTSKVAALLYAVLTTPFMLVGIVTYFSDNAPEPGGEQFGFARMFFIFAPIIYGVMGYLFTGLASLVYNLVAKYVGGVEFVVTEKPDS